MNESPDWTPGNVIRSAVDVLQLGVGAARVLVGNMLSRADAWLCDYGNEDQNGRKY